MTTWAFNDYHWLNDGIGRIRITPISDEPQCVHGDRRSELELDLADARNEEKDVIEHASERLFYKMME